MRYQPVEVCIECGLKPPIKKRRICRSCYRPKNNEASKRCKNLTRVSAQMLNVLLYCPECKKVYERYKGFTQTGNKKHYVTLETHYTDFPTSGLPRIVCKRCVPSGIKRKLASELYYL